MLVAKVSQSLKGAVHPRTFGQQTRSIHVQGRVLQPARHAHSALDRLIFRPGKLAHRVRTLISRFITHLQGPPVPRLAHPSPSIRQSLSLPARVALSRPLRAPYLPRAPFIPSNVAQVGLGTARNFSTGRPIFQHIVENVPVTGRALYELDWDVKLRKEKEAKVRRPKRSIAKAELPDKPKPRITTLVGDREHEELDFYFSPPSVLPVVTYLQIPLAPTPTARVPLSYEPSPRLLPLPTLAKELASHSTHSIKVSSIFCRLDAAKVWEKGASYETYGDPSGLCTILRIKFEGWAEERVRNVLGYAGKDWCTIQEIRQEASPTKSLAWTAPQGLEPETAPSVGDYRDIAFVVPSLDISVAPPPPTILPETSASHASLSKTATDYSFPSALQSIYDEDSVSDVSSLETFDSADEWFSIAASSPRSQSWIGFSSDFADRAFLDSSTRGRSST